MYAHARRATGRDEAFCLDVVHDAFLKIIRKIRRIDDHAALGAWVRRVVLTTALDALRAEQRRAKRERAAARPDESGGPAQSPEATSVSGGLDWIERELADLDEQTAGLLLARHRFGWTLARIGAAFGMTTGTVDGRVNRAVRRMRTRADQERADD